MNEPNGFVIKTKSGKDFYINATSEKEKNDWMVQIAVVKRCYLMRQRAQEHINRHHYKQVRVGAGLHSRRWTWSGRRATCGRW